MTAVLFVVFGVAIPVIATLKAGGSPKAWAVWGFWATAHILIVAVGLQLLMVFLMGAIWIALVRRQPHLDQTRRGLLVGCLIVALPATFSGWVPLPSVWLRNPTAQLGFATTVAALIVIVLNYLGVLFPRLIVPGLKQGQLIPPLDDTDPEPVR
jgi:hypothetical protein